MEYDAIFGVEAVIVEPLAPKGKQRGYSYKVEIKRPTPEMKPYLYGNSITLSTFHKEAQYQTDQKLWFKIGCKLNKTHDKQGNEKTFKNGYIIAEGIDVVDVVDMEKDPTDGEEFLKEIDSKTTSINGGTPVDPVEWEDKSASCDGAEDKMGLIKQIVDIVKPLAPEGQQAIMNPLFRYLGK